MAPLERLFAYEIQFQSRLRTERMSLQEFAGLHTSYALGLGYEPIIKAVGSVTVRDIDRVMGKLTLAGDVRDVLRARDSVMRILGVRQFEGH